MWCNEEMSFKSPDTFQMLSVECPKASMAETRIDFFG